MAFSGRYSLSSQTLATLSPMRPRKVCVNPTSFQWRARQSWQYQPPTLSSQCPGVLPAPTVLKRQLNSTSKRCRGSGVGENGSSERSSQSQAHSSEHTAKNDGVCEPIVPESGNSSIAANGATVVNRGKISAEVKKAMRSVPQPVTIITSADMSTGKPVFRGATISSFNTVTIEPTTIVSLNIKRPSSTFDAIESSGYFLVHLLSATQENSELAQAFTKGVPHKPFQTLEGVSQIPLSEDFGPVERLHAGPPIIRCPSPGHLLCRYLPDKTVEVGDHVVIFGTVDSVKGKRDFLEEANETCLVYANGQFGRVSPLEPSSAVKITKTAFRYFVRKIKRMDHSSLDYLGTSFGIHLDQMTPDMRSSFVALLSNGQRVVEAISRLGQNATTLKIVTQTSERQSVARKYVHNDWILPRIRGRTTQPFPPVEQYVPDFSKGEARTVRVRPAVRKVGLKSSPGELAGDEIRPRFLDPLARRVECVEHREESIKSGLGLIEEVMASERPVRAGDNKTDRQRVVVSDEDRESPKTQQPRPSSKVLATADWFFDVVGGGESKVVRS